MTLIVFLNSTQDCFKASWASHKSVHLKAKLSVRGTGENSSLVSEGWLYCIKKGQAQTPKLPHFDWTGYFSMIYLPIALSNLSFKIKKMCYSFHAKDCELLMIFGVIILLLFYYFR